MIMRDRVPCRVPLIGAAVLGLLALIALPGWSLSQQAAPEKKTEPQQTAPVDRAFVILNQEVVDGPKTGGDAERLDRLEKQLETLLKEVKAMRAGTAKSDSPG